MHSDPSGLDSLGSFCNSELGFWLGEVCKGGSSFLRQLSWPGLPSRCCTEGEPCSVLSWTALLLTRRSAVCFTRVAHTRGLPERAWLYILLS